MKSLAQFIRERRAQFVSWMTTVKNIKITWIWFEGDDANKKNISSRTVNVGDHALGSVDRLLTIRPKNVTSVSLNQVSWTTPFKPIKQLVGGKTTMYATHCLTINSSDGTSVILYETFSDAQHDYNLIKGLM